jgi:chromosome segregation ATPase
LEIRSQKFICMYLQKLELQGFKSFAHKTVLEFLRTAKEKKGITAIVGPNGSGKSNIADAIRWALGEQSLKLLRGKKSEDVIFLGSNKKTRLGFAEVSLSFNNEDRAIPLDYQEVVLARRIYRSGESEYFINKSKVRLLDLVLLASESNFGQRSYSVIGQGMIDAILAATPTQRKEFFDEAAGVSQYQIKRDQAKNKLLAAEENLKQAEVLLQEIEPRLRSLTRQVKKLERREEIENQLRKIQEQYYGTIWQAINKKVEESDSKIKTLENREKTIGEKVNSLKQELNSLEKEIPHSNSFRDLQKEYEKLFEEKNGLREKEIIIRNKIELKKHQKTSLPLFSTQEILNELRSFYENHESFLLKIQNKKIDFNEIEKETEKLHQQLKNLLEKLNLKPQARGETEADPALQKDLNQIAAQIEKINRLLTEVQAKIVNLNDEEDKKRKNFFELQRTLEYHRNELNNLTAEINELKIELTRNQTRKEDLESEIRQELKNIDPVALANVAPELNPEQMLPEIQKLKHQLELIGGIDQEVQKEYNETQERYTFLHTQFSDLSKTKISLEQMIKELDETIEKQFNSAFNQMNQEFAKYFKILFGGGKAELALLKEENLKKEDENANDEPPNQEAVSGVEIYANPPGKRLKNISMLSGGERALISIALICAIISCNPSPFVVLDEVDAALDESNSIKFANILDELSFKTQFVVITHNRATMQRANVLYGVTMTDEGTSKLLSVNLKEVEKTMTKS